MIKEDFVEIEIKNGQGYFIVDKKFEYLKNYKWRLSRGYPVTSNRKKHFIGGKEAFAHKIVLSLCVENLVGMVDHKNRNKLDNRVSNLRTCTKSQNAMNSYRKPRIYSKFKGVSYDKTKKKWVSSTMCLDKKVYKRFNTELEAALFHDESVVKMHGDFALTNKGMGLL